MRVVLFDGMRAGRQTIRAGRRIGAVCFPLHVTLAAPSSPPRYSLVSPSYVNRSISDFCSTVTVTAGNARSPHSIGYAVRKRGGNLVCYTAVTLLHIGRFSGTPDGAEIRPIEKQHSRPVNPDKLYSFKRERMAW